MKGAYRWRLKHRSRKALPRRELVPIDKLREQHKVGRATYAGVCAANGWRPGKAMTEDEFLAAVAKFNNSPMNGRKSKEARK